MPRISGNLPAHEFAANLESVAQERVSGGTGATQTRTALTRRSLVNHRRCDDVRLLAIGALELFTPCPIFVNWPVGDYHCFVGVVIPAVVPFRNGDIFTAPFDVAENLRGGVANIVSQRKIRENFAEAPVLAREMTFEFRLDVLILLGDDNANGASQEGNQN